MALVGCIFGVSSVYMETNALNWAPVITGLLVGSVGGVVAARRATRKWQAELQAQGRISRAAAFWRSWVMLLALVVFDVLIAVFFSDRVVPFVGRLDGLNLLASYGLPTFFASYGGYIWLWARRREREGFWPLVIRISADRSG